LALAAVLALGTTAAVNVRVPHEPAARKGGEDSWCHTFSIVAYDPDQKEWGVGVASRVLAVGAVVPYAKAGVGAVATQSFTNKTYGPNGLKLLADGKTPEDVIKVLTSEDKLADLRQVGLIDAKGNVAHFTGKKCNPYAGAKSGKNYCCQGNLLAGEAVINDMAKAFEETQGRLAWRIMAALTAAEKAGGDKRGKQSAALLIVKDQAGYLGSDDRYVDLRVDDHKEPVTELARLVGIRGVPKK
jgi:uncharacterized Ntn-hydrolase superfamily protein